jgi:hypothetical protein
MKALSTRLIEMALKVLDGFDYRQMQRWGEVAETIPANVATPVTQRGREGRVDGRAGQEMLSFDVHNSKEVCTSTTAVDLHRGRDWWQEAQDGAKWRHDLADSGT